LPVDDKALASYARQAHDETMLKLAMRIQARAMQRVGELLKEIEPSRGANQNIGAGARPKVTRTQAATDTGLSAHQRKTALRVAGIPPDEFEAAIESDKPPTETREGASPQLNRARAGAGRSRSQAATAEPSEGARTKLTPRGPDRACRDAPTRRPSLCRRRHRQRWH
jgi:hypothetical protein